MSLFSLLINFSGRHLKKKIRKTLEKIPEKNSFLSNNKSKVSSKIPYHGKG